MKHLLAILILLPIFCHGQLSKMMVGAHRTGPQRVLIDLGGNGVGDLTFTDTGVMTPDNTSRTGQAADGNWWNNITNGEPNMTLLSNPVDSHGNLITGFTITIDKWPRGTFSTTDSSMNFSGWTAAVGDYPASATIDNMYFHSTAGVVSMTVTIPFGKKARIKFWGSRVTTGVNRTLQVKKSTDATYTESFNALNNSNYNQAATITELSGTAVLNLRVTPGVSFGHISVMDITLEDL